MLQCVRVFACVWGVGGGGGCLCVCVCHLPPNVGENFVKTVQRSFIEGMTYDASAILFHRQRRNSGSALDWKENDL